MKIKSYSIVFLIAVIIILVNSQLRAQIGNQTNTIRTAFAAEQITVIGTAVTFTAATINPTSGGSAGVSRATLATCVNSTAEIRILSTGTAPTATVGLVVPVGGSFKVYGYTNISNFKAIRTTGTSGVLDCEYSR